MLRVYVKAFVLFIGINAEFDPEKHKNWVLLPHDVCGQRESYRIIGGSETSLNAFPWIARIGVTTRQKVHFSCGGVLVNSDTILTAAHCLPVKNYTKLGPIRLGEYNTETDPDCESGVCADPVIDATPLLFLAPASSRVSLFNNDIAIIKLKKNVTFSASVSPICIGNKEFFSKDFVGRTTEVAGWGYTNVETKRRSKKLEFIKIPVLKHETCVEKYKVKLQISKTQFCAGGEPGVDACNGDSGGPIMIVDDGNHGPRYYLLGIVSFGPVNCGNPRFPGIYTNLTAFIEWVFDNLDGSGVNSYKIKF